MELNIELDDVPIPEATISFTAKYQPAERDTGTPAGWYVEDLAITSWEIGGLILTRDQLVESIGEAEVERIEEAHTDRAIEQAIDAAQGAEDDRGDYLRDLRADDLLT